MAGMSLSRMAILDPLMTQDVDNQDDGSSDFVVALTPAQLGVVAAIVAAAIIWFVTCRKSTA